ncbi:unnamed protein product [Ectocarpus fasciculatus]
MLEETPCRQRYGSRYNDGGQQVRLLRLPKQSGEARCESPLHQCCLLCACCYRSTSELPPTINETPDPQEQRHSKQLLKPKTSQHRMRAPPRPSSWTAYAKKVRSSRKK